MNKKTLKMLGFMFLGVVMGFVWGIIFGENANNVKFLGEIFLNALKMLIIPLVMASMITGITGLGDIRELGKTGLTTVLFYMFTTSLAVMAGIILVNIIQPGVGIDTANIADAAEKLSKAEAHSFTDVLVGMVPENLVVAMHDLEILPLIVFAIFFGGVLSTMPEKGRPLIKLFESLNEVMMKMVEVLMIFAPIGVFGLIAGRLGDAGGLEGFMPELSKLFYYALTVVLGLLIHAVVLMILLSILTRRNPIEFLIGMLTPLMTAFSTASSSATLPLTLEAVEHNNKVSRESATFVLPLGATINMDGTALYESVAAIFIAQSYGISLGFSEQAIIFFTATLAAVGAAGIPEAGLVTMVMVLNAVGLPLEGIGLLLAIDWMLDRCRTTVNVWGDSVGAAVVDKLAGPAPRG